MSNILFSRLSVVLTEMRERQANMTVQTLQVFMVVAAKGEINSVEIRKILGIPQPSVSRALGDLGEWAQRRGQEGLNLVKTERDLVDQRNTVSSLTPQGKALAAKIEQIMGA